MDSTVYYTLKVIGLPASHEDLFTHELFERGAAGIQEDLQFQQKDRSYLPEVLEAEIKNLTVYFEEPPSPNLIEDIQSLFPEAQFQREEHETEDWLEKWKEQWKPFELVANVWIVPDWHKDTFQADKGAKIFIEPGMAFGTGTHATTQVAASLLQMLRSQSQVKTMVDVGTGSGILAFLASLEGFEKIYAYDNDPESKRVFHENVEKNPNPGISWCENWESELSQKVELTLANIIDGVLLDLKPLFQKVESQYYIFTGILAEREEAFLKEMLSEWPLQTSHRMEKEGWVGLLFERRS